MIQISVSLANQRREVGRGPRLVPPVPRGGSPTPALVHNRSKGEKEKVKRVKHFCNWLSPEEDWRAVTAQLCIIAPAVLYIGARVLVAFATGGLPLPW